MYANVRKEFLTLSEALYTAYKEHLRMAQQRESDNSYAASLEGRVTAREYLHAYQRLQHVIESFEEKP